MAFDYKLGYHRYKHYFLKIRQLGHQPIARTSFTVAATLFTISFFAFFAVRPAANTIVQLIKELKEQQKVDEILAKKTTDLSKAKSSYEAIEDYLISLDRSLPQEANFNLFAKKIQFLVFSHNLILASASFDKFDLITPNDLANQEPKILKFKITTAGGFEDTKNFLDSLEKLDRIVKINFVNFSTQTKLEKAQIQSEINGDIFWLPYSKNVNSNE